MSLVYETVHQIASSLQLITCGKAMLPKEEKMPHQPRRNPKDLVTSGESGVALCGGQCDTLSDTHSLCGISAKFKRNLYLSLSFSDVTDLILILSWFWLKNSNPSSHREHLKEYWIAFGCTHMQCLL